MKQIELLTNFDIIELCDLLQIPLLECSAKTRINKNPLKKCGYVVNLDDYDGSHWTAIFIYNNNGIYFDSYNAEPPLEIINFFDEHNIKWNSNNQQIQHLKSSACGYYCIAFLYHMTKYCNKNDLQLILYDFIEMFDTVKQEENDKILQKYINQIFKHLI